MKLFEELNGDNFELFAAHYYNNPQCSNTEEFYEDLNRFKYLKRLLRRYIKDGDLQERLVLNHIIIIYNVFGIPAANKMMFHKMEIEYWSAIKTFLVYLNYLPSDEKVAIPLDQEVIKRLREL
jgi:hypothetical protein